MREIKFLIDFEKPSVLVVKDDGYYNAIGILNKGVLTVKMRS